MKSELIITTTGIKVWKLPNGQLHRQDGPAVEYNNGSKSWWLNGIKYTEQKYKHKTRSMKLKLLL
jgi:hypothetical protein